MKKFLFGILTFLGIGLSFCNADTFILSGSLGDFDCINNSSISFSIPYFDYNFSSGGYYVEFSLGNDFYVRDFSFQPLFYIPGGYSVTSINIWSYSFNLNNSRFYFSNYRDFGGFQVDGSFVCDGISSYPVFYSIYKLTDSSSTPSSSDIDVYYNNGNSVENITCDGTQAISINGLSTITSTNTFTPYFNISYTDEDNQSLIESYSKDILYLSGGLFKKTYTGNNERILTDITESPNSSFSGYLPTFEITGGIEEVSESGNIFNNFAENSVKFAFSNIPSYIQYVLIFMLLFFILRLVRPFKKRR